MQKFEYLDHTADLKVRAKGKTLEEAFENVALGAVNFITDVSKVRKKDEHKVSVRSKRLESLLYDFLEELLYLIDTEGFLFSGASKMVIAKEADGEYSLSCKALGDSYKSYERKGDLKAVTYSDMEINEKRGGFEVIVVFDI